MVALQVILQPSFWKRLNVFSQDSENKLIMYANGNNGPLLMCLFLPLVNN